MADPVQARFELASRRLNRIAADGDVSTLRAVIADLLEMAGEHDDGAKVPVWQVWNRLGNWMGFDELSSEGYAEGQG